MLLIDLIHKGTLDIIPAKSFDRLSHSDVLMNALVAKVHRLSALAEDPDEPMSRTTKGNIEDGVEKEDDELIDPLPSEIEPSSKASHGSSMAEGKPRSCNKNNKNTRKSSPLHKARKLKKA